MCAITCKKTSFFTSCHILPLNSVRHFFIVSFGKSVKHMRKTILVLLAALSILAASCSMAYEGTGSVDVSVQSAVFPRTRPRAVSTVLPAQFPVCCRSPVRALNTVLLPTFGLPHRATRSTLIFCLPPQGRGRSARLRFEAPPPCPGFGRPWDRQKRKETGR